MPWQEVDTMSLRKEFIMLAKQPGANRRALCRRFGISPKTAYKWLARYKAVGAEGLADRSRRPHTSPQRTATDVERSILTLRDKHPAWGGRKLRSRLEVLEQTDLPSPSTITDILRRHGRLNATEWEQHTAWKRFEHEAPNQLWQMDFKGHFAMNNGRCHPLTVLDDHSRYALELGACADERGSTVQARLTAVFRRYGLPERMTMDNGAPWGGESDYPYTVLTVWLIRLGVRVSHSRPYHPQTQGKDERFHRTLNVEVIRHAAFRDLAHCQRRFDQWRPIYNLERPHEALGMKPPVSRYQPSPRPFPQILPTIEYGPGDVVRKIQDKGDLHYRGCVFRVGRAFHGYPVALRHTVQDGLLDVYFCQQRIAQIDLRIS